MERKHICPKKCLNCPQNSHPSLKVIILMNTLSQDMENQDHELCMSNKESMVTNQCFMNTKRSNEHVEECATHQASHKVSYSQVIEIKRIATTRECTH